MPSLFAPHRHSAFARFGDERTFTASCAANSSLPSGVARISPPPAYSTRRCSARACLDYGHALNGAANRRPLCAVTSPPRDARRPTTEARAQTTREHDDSSTGRPRTCRVYRTQPDSASHPEPMSSVFQARSLSNGLDEYTAVVSGDKKGGGMLYTLIDSARMHLDIARHAYYNTDCVRVVTTQR